MKILKCVLAVLEGMVAGVEALGHAVYPPPAGLDMTDTPAGALVSVLLAWGAGSIVGGGWPTGSRGARVWSMP